MPSSTISIYRQKGTDALQEPNGISIHWNEPLGVIGAVFPASPGFLIIRQNPDVKFNMLKKLEPSKASKHSPVQGSRYAPSLVTSSN
jgi:hypothetical protein